MDNTYYLTKKYIEIGLLDENGNKLNKDWFDPNIYPDEGYIPQCTKCVEDFNVFKTKDVKFMMQVKWHHKKSCLWHDYFIDKIKQICPTVKIEYN